MYKNLNSSIKVNVSFSRWKIKIKTFLACKIGWGKQERKCKVHWDCVEVREWEQFFFSFIHHFHIFDNAPYLRLPTPQILHKLCFSFLLGITAVPRGIKTNAIAKFWGANKVHHWKCGSGVSKWEHWHWPVLWRSQNSIVFNSKSQISYWWAVLYYLFIERSELQNRGSGGN